MVDNVYANMVVKNNELFSTLLENGIQEIYFVVDTYYDNLVKDLRIKQSNPANRVQCYWVQNKQTLYDPAGKTTPSTKAGYRPETHKKGAGVFVNNDNVLFSWENPEHGSLIDIYPKWDLDVSEDIDINDLPNKNIMYYSKYDVCQVINKQTDNYEKQESHCIIKTPKNKIVIITKTMASKKGNTIAKLASASAAASRSFDDFIAEISGFTDITGIDTYTDIYHVLAKRLGDQGQALSCLKDSFSLIVKDRDGIKRNQLSNGYHCFVTFDLPALSGALLYNVPIILYCYNKGNYHLFIRKDLLAPEKLLETSKQRYKGLYVQMRTMYASYAGLLAEFYAQKVELKKRLKGFLELPITSPKEYQTFIASFLKNMKLVLLFASYDERSLHLKIEGIPESIDGLTSYEDASKIMEKLNNIINIIRAASFCINSKEDDLEISKLNKAAIKKIESAFMYLNRTRIGERLLETYYEASTAGAYIHLIYNILLTDWPLYAETFKIRILEALDTLLTLKANGSNADKEVMYGNIREYVNSQFVNILGEEEGDKDDDEDELMEGSAPLNTTYYNYNEEESEDENVTRPAKRAKPSYKGGMFFVTPPSANNNIGLFRKGSATRSVSKSKSITRKSTSAKTVSLNSAISLDESEYVWNDGYCKMALVLYIIAKSANIRIDNDGIHQVMSDLYGIFVKNMQKGDESEIENDIYTDEIMLQMRVYPELWHIFKNIVIKQLNIQSITLPDTTILYEYISQNKDRISVRSSKTRKSKRGVSSRLSRTGSKQSKFKKTRSSRSRSRSRRGLLSSAQFPLTAGEPAETSPV